MLLVGNWALMSTRSAKVHERKLNVNLTSKCIFHPRSLVWAGAILHQFKKLQLQLYYQKKIIRTLKDIKNQSYFMHKMNRLLAQVVSWYNFKLIWLHRFLVIKTLKRKIKLTLTGEVEKQGFQAVATPHNITINNKLNFHYLLTLYVVLQKKDKI